MRKFKKSLAVVLLSASLVAVASCTKTNSEVNPTPINDIIDPFLTGTDVFIGDTVTITPREIEKDGKYYPCYDFYTITPDGNRLSGEKQYISVAGQYETIFLARLEDGSFITDSDTFIAYERAFSVEKETSSTKYTDEILGDFEHTTPGITTTLTEGDTWHYNQIIDISGSSLAKPIIKFYSSPMSEYINGDVAPFIDASKQVLRISDYYDPTNYIDIQIGYFLANQGTGRMQTYAVAGGATQSATGCMPNTTPWGTRRLVTIDGIDYSCCFGFDDFGATMNTVPGWKSNRHHDPAHTGPDNPDWRPDVTNSDGYGYSVYYIEETKRIYIQHRDLIFVTDLDEAKIYNDNVFKGFTTGEVTLSLHFDGYQSSKATFEITEIYGKKGEELKEIKVIDDKAPIINVDCPEKNLYIARNEEFTVPAATAQDAHLKGDVIKEVIFEKGSSFEKYIPLVNGKFTPTDIGEYTIVYTAKDAFDNTSTKEIKCLAVNCTDNKLVAFTYTPIQDETPAGTEVTFIAPTVSSPNNKGLFANITIVAPDGEETKFNALDGNVPYLLKRVGKYKVMYQYGDVAKSYIESYEFNAGVSENVYLETTIFPTYIIKNALMSLEDNKAVLCDKADIHYVDTKFEYTEDNGSTWNEITDINNFTITTEATTSVKFRYSYNNNVIYTTDEITVIDVGFKTTDFDLSKYFYNKEESWACNLSNQNIQLSTSASDSKLDFINSLSFSNFSIKFNFLAGSQFDKFKMVLTDYYEPANVVEFEFSYQGASLYLKVLDQTIDLGVTDSVNLNYDYVSSSIYYSVSSFFRLDNPFVNDRFYLGFEFTSPNTDTGIILTQLLNQQFKTITKDTTKPLLTSNKLSGYYSKGEEINIHQTYACDVLSPYLRENHTLIVQYQTDVGAPVEIVKSIDGVTLDGKENADRDYNIALTKNGLYIIKYRYVDQSNNSYELQDSLHVVDDEAPVITIEGATSTTIDTCGLNADVKVRNVTVEDENEYTLTIYAVSPNGAMSKVENNTFKANVKGLWKVVYYAVDSVGNVGSAYYQVNCQ